MKTLFTFFALALTLALNALEIDSVQWKKIVREGQTELCNLIEYNSHVKSPEEMKFMVIVDGNDPNYSRVVTHNTQSQTNSTDILSQSCIDTLDARLSRTYRDYGIEMYVIVIQTFNIVVKADLPQPVNIAHLFTEPLYDAQTNLAELRTLHSSITASIITGTFSARNRDCLIYSRASYSGALIQGKTGKWDFCKRVLHHASQATYPKLDQLGNYFYERLLNNTDASQGGLEYALQEVAKEFNESAKYIALKAAILTTYTSSGMSAILDQFNERVDWEGLTEQERIHALAVFAGYSMNDNMFTHEERHACKIIENTPKNQVPLLLADLEEVTPMYNNSSYGGIAENEALIATLIKEIDDAIVGDGDNYARLMRGLTQIELSNELCAGSHMPVTNDDWLKRRIYWDDWSLFDCPQVGTCDYDVNIKSDGKVEVDHEVVDYKEKHISGDQSATIFYTAHWDDTYETYELRPFDLVIFTNRSSLGMLQVAGAAVDQPFLAPAIFLKYADKKAFNTNTITVTALVLDVAAIATGPLAIGAALRTSNYALAAFEALQVIGSAANIVVNAAASPEAQEAVNMFNMVVAGWGLSRIAVSGSKFTVEYLNAVTDGRVTPIPTTTANLYVTRYDQVTTWANVDDATKTRMEELRNLLRGQTIASELEATTQFSRAAINNLNGFSNEITGLAAAHDLSLAEFMALEAKSAAEMTQVEKNTINAIRNSVPTPGATTIMQKVVPKSDIGKYLDGTYRQVGGFISTANDTKHLTTFDDLFYGLRLDYDGTAFNLNDGSCGVIRYKTNNVNQIHVPRSTVNGGVDDGLMPYTGHGFTSGNNGRLGAPEWKSSYLTPNEGAELWEIFSDGSEVLRGKFSLTQNKFIAVP